jgi:hypothetical protein
MLSFTGLATLGSMLFVSPLTFAEVSLFSSLSTDHVIIPFSLVTFRTRFNSRVRIDDIKTYGGKIPSITSVQKPGSLRRQIYRRRLAIEWFFRLDQAAPAFARISGHVFQRGMRADLGGELRVSAGRLR